jgi:hypothetical protein
LVFAFQNCNKGFEVDSVDQQNSSQNQTTDSTLLHSAQLTELQGHTFHLDGSQPLSFPDGLPKGMVYEASTRRINWMPVQGQAGTYRFRVFEGGEQKGLVAIKVNSLSATTLKVSGPPYSYGDADVGYIFVHGAGDVDRCANQKDLLDYWGGGPQTVAPLKNFFLVCYDSRKAVASVAHDVAKQMLTAACGHFNKCIVITHSMGGLLMEHMFLHTRAAAATDPVPSMYQDRALYQAVRDRTLFVISIASAAGGSKAASVVNRDGTSLLQSAVGVFSGLFGLNTDATKNLVTEYASKVVAPYTENPGVPFFMVGGFTNKTLDDISIFGSVFGLIDVPRSVFDGNREFAAIDKTTSFWSRSDGMVDFRSACGVASPSDDDGVGRSAGLGEHFKYCWSAPKKPNHYVWFLTNMNHSVIKDTSYNCHNSDWPCTFFFPNAAAGSFASDSSLTGMNAMQVIRRKIAGANLIPQ